MSACVSFCAGLRCRIRNSLQAEEIVAGVFIASDRAAAFLHSLHAEEFVAGQRVCVFSDRTMAHQHLESVVVRKNTSEGWATLFIFSFAIIAVHHVGLKEN